VRKGKTMNGLTAVTSGRIEFNPLL
jgi:hypothetical protein